jgi:hypothetical protein
MTWGIEERLASPWIAQVESTGENMAGDKLFIPEFPERPSLLPRP